MGCSPEYLGAATLHSLSWDPTSPALILIFTQLCQLQPLTKNTRSLVMLSTNISECTERRGKAKPENRSLPWLCPCYQNGWSQQEKSPKEGGCWSHGENLAVLHPFSQNTAMRELKCWSMARFGTRLHPPLQWAVNTIHPSLQTHCSS